MGKDIAKIKESANSIRINALKAIHEAGSGHPGGSLSSADILASLYFGEMNIDPSNPDAKGRDRLVLSKGHAAPALYAALGERGYYDTADIMTLRKMGSKFQGHPNMRKVPGVEMSTGSLGQGFSVAVGMATAGKIDSDPGTVYVLTGDGELQEGIIWEAAMAASHRGLDNLIAIVDLNGLQIDGEVDKVKKVTPVDEKFRSFGWDAEVIDGHDIDAILGAIERGKAASKPYCIVAKTVKGKGVSFMEGQAGWHGKAPSDEEFEQAMKELGGDK
jgi:transketolase